MKITQTPNCRQRGSPSIYLRLSVTPECNLRCRYCRPGRSTAEGPRASLLNDDELVALVSSIDRVRPIRKLRFTGGEPLLKPDLPDLVARFGRLLPGAEFCLTTNGVLLKEKARAIRRAGVTALNVSLDTTDDEVFRRLTRTGGLRRVIDGIEAARAARFSRLKLNSVLLRSFNSHQISSLVGIAARNECEIRFVELMPIGQGATLFDREFLSAEEALEKMKGLYSYRGPRSPSATAQRHLFEVEGREVTIGFITSVSHPFCRGCDRIRLDSAGRIYSCLRDERGDALVQLMRAGKEEELKERIACSLVGGRGMEKNWPERQMVQLGG
jgi:GTP 3',8-cyclase